MRRLALLALLLPSLSSAQVPGRLGYQGRLLKADGSPESGVVSLSFSLFSGPSGGQALWTEQQQLALADGYYAALLGEVAALPPLDGSDLYLEVGLGGSALTPRHKVASVPFALLAGDARNVVGGKVDASSITVNGKPFVDSSGKADWAQLKACSAEGEILKWSNGAWACAADAGGMTSVKVSAPLAGEGSASAPISLAAASATQDGYLAASDWKAFDAKVSGLSAGKGIELTGAATSPSIAVKFGTAEGTAAAGNDPRFAAAVTAVNAGAGVAVSGSATSPTVGVKYGTTAGTAAAGDDPRLSDARDPKPGSGHYVQNGTSPQNASFNLSGNGTVANLTVTGSLVVNGSVPTGGRNLLPNPDLTMGTRGWLGPSGYTGYTYTRTRETDANAPVSSRQKLKFTVTNVGSSGDAYLAWFTLASLKLNTDYNISCYAKTLNGAIGIFNVERHFSDWTGRSDADIAWSYSGDGKWHRVGGTFNTADRPNVHIYLRGFNATGTWEVTGCQLTEGKYMTSFSVDSPDLPCPDSSAIANYGFCIHHVGNYDKTFHQAAAVCRDLGMRLCSLAELSAAHAVGASWCSWGWVSDRTSASAGYAAYPIQTISSGCGGSVNVQVTGAAFSAQYGANCCR